MYIVHISQLYAEVVAENWNFTLVSKKNPYHLLHIYCTATTTTITVAAMVSISIKNGALNLWDWFLLFMNCLLRMT